MRRLILLALSVMLVVPLLGQNVRVSGTVRDAAGTTLPGVGVVQRGDLKNGTVTDIDGKYSITVPSDGFLEFSSLGFKTVLEAVSGRAVIDVRMSSETTALEQSVVIGYGTSKKQDLTGAVAVVDVEDVKDAPVTSVAEALQGRIAGVDIVSGSGEAGESTSIQIRGARSISAGNEPLIVVDGVVDAVSDLNEINPSDITGISVLKDVSSTAIYGSRGANGVIIVTTSQKPQKGAKYTATLKSSTGFSHVAGTLDLMDATEYATWMNMVRIAQYPSTSLTPQAPGSAWPYYNPEMMGRGTDWVKTLSQTGIYNNQYAAVSAHSEGINVWAAFGYTYNRGVVIGSSYNRYTGRANVDTKLGKRLTIGARFNLTFYDVNRTNAAISGTNTNSAIFLSPLLNTESTWNQYGYEESAGTVFNNPYISAKNIDNHADKWSFNIVPWAKIDFGKGLVLNTTFSFTRDNDLGGYYSPSWMPVAEARHTGGTAQRTYWDQQKILSETTLNWKKTLRRRHSLELLAGFTASRRTQDNSVYKGTGFLNDEAGYNNMAAIANSRSYTASSYKYLKTTMSVLGRVNYNYRRRYYLTFTARADGASNFSSNRKWGFFPAGAFRWSISNEEFLRDAYWLNDLSLRVSAGRSGNDAISSYLSMATVQTDRSSWVFGDNQLMVTMPARLANPNLTWETTDSYNVGLNFSAWKSRVTIEADAYYSKTSDLLLSVRNAQTTGYNTYFANMGSTRNIGVELSLTTKNVSVRNFEWTSVFTVSHNSQKVLDSGAGDEVVPTVLNPRSSTQYIYGYRKGYPVNALWGYRYAGVWHSQDEIDRNAYTRTYVSNIRDGANGSNVGRARYVDVNGDGNLNQDDLVCLGSSDPVAYGGFQNNFKLWGRLNVNIYFAYSIGGKMYNLSELWLGSTGSSYNKYRYVLDCWHPVRNPDSDIPAAGYQDNLASDFYVHDASFLRLKSLTISYNILLSRWSKVFKSLNIGVSGENLFLLKRYNGFDPDVSTSGTVRRLDNGSFPRPRTYTLNLELKF